MAKFMIAAFGLIAVINSIEALPAQNPLILNLRYERPPFRLNLDFGPKPASGVGSGVNLTRTIELRVKANTSINAAALALIRAESSLKAVSSYYAAVKPSRENYIKARGAMIDAESFLIQTESNISAAVGSIIKAYRIDGLGKDDALIASLETTVLALTRAHHSSTVVTRPYVLLIEKLGESVRNSNLKPEIDTAIAAVGEARKSLAAAAGIIGEIGIAGKKLFLANVKGQAKADVNGQLMRKLQQ